MADVNRSIQFGAEEYVIYINKNQQIKATVDRISEDAPKQTQLIWKTSDESVAKVSGNGIITAVSAGITTITAYAKDDETVSKSVRVEIRKPVANVVLNTKDAKLLIGAADELARIDLNYEIAPEDAYHQDVEWSSSNEKVAIVDENGIVTALSKGNATITAKSTDPSVTKKATCQISVTQAVTAITIAEEKITNPLPVPKTFQIKATVEPADAGNKKLIWTSSDENIATVSANGNIKGVSTGTVVITASAADGSGISASYTVTVVMPVKKITIDTNKVILPPNAEWQLTALPEPETATVKELAWKSSNEDVASVSQDGLITANKLGNCRITASAVDGSNVNASVNIEVKNFDVVITQKGAVRVSFDTHETSGYTMMVTSSGSYRGPFSITVKIANGCVKTTSNNGELMPVKPGTDTVTVTRKYGRSNKETYSIYVGQEILATTRIEDLGSGNDAIIPDESEGVFSDHFYKVFEEYYTWDEAKAYCEKLGGHLVTICSEEENSFVESMLGQKKVYWIGMKLDENNQVYWITDESVAYQNFHVNDPDNYLNQQGYCAMIGTEWSGWQRGEWCDMERDGIAWNGDASWSNLGFICEWETVPEEAKIIKN